MCVRGEGGGGGVCGGKVRGDWWFTEERWWVIHLRQSRQSPWQHEWPVICHPAQRPPLRISAGWDVYTPSAFIPLASHWTVKLYSDGARPAVCLLDSVSQAVHPSLQSLLQLARMRSERTCQDALACPLTCRDISISLTGRLIFINVTASISLPLHVCLCAVFGRSLLFYPHSTHVHLTKPHYDEASNTPSLAKCLNF